MTDAVETKAGDNYGTYVRRKVDDRIWEQIGEAVRMTLAGPEGRAVVVTGPSGAGKTTLLARAMERHPVIRTAISAGVGVLEIEAPAPCSLSELGRIVAMRASGYGMRASANSTIAWDGARRAMAAQGIRILRIDEGQNVVRSANETERTKLLDTIRMLLVTRGQNVALVMSGQPDLTRLILQDDQIVRRASFSAIEPVDASLHPALASGIKDIARRAGIPISRELDAVLVGELVPRLAHASLAQFGASLERAAMTIRHVLRTTDARGRARAPATELSMNHFADHWAMNTGNAHFQNPFLSPEWRGIDCRKRDITHPSQLEGRDEARGR